MVTFSVICASNNCIYTSTLLSKLIQNGSKPKAVFCTRQDRAFDLLRGWAGRLLFFKRNIRYYMKSYARANNLKGWQNQISMICRQNNIPFTITRDVANKITEPIDLIIYCGGLGIVKKDVLSIPKIGVLGTHHGRLPDYRGSDCLGWMMFKGEPPAVTAFFLDQGIDTGDILLCKEIFVDSKDSYFSIRSKAIVLAVDLLTNCMEQIKAGTIKRIKQKKEEGTTYRKFAKYGRQLLR